MGKKRRGLGEGKEGKKDQKTIKGYCGKRRARRFLHDAYSTRKILPHDLQMLGEFKKRHSAFTGEKKKKRKMKGCPVNIPVEERKKGRGKGMNFIWMWIKESNSHFLQSAGPLSFLKRIKDQHR